MADGSPQRRDFIRASRETARSLTPVVAWPTLAMALLLPAATASLIWLGATARVPLIVATPILSYLVYCHFIVVHEAMHHNIFPGRRDLIWLETVFGWMGSTTLLSSYPQLKSTHLLHHAHLNGPGDPDALLARGSFQRLLVNSLSGVVLYALPPSLRFRLVGGEKAKQYRACLSDFEWRAYEYAGWAQLAVGVFCFWQGFGLQWFMLWLAPGRLGGTILNVFIVWAPHQPFQSSDQFKGTRLLFSPGLSTFLWWNNMHMLHHLHPGMPFYQYPAFYRRWRDTLVAEGARIEGVVPGSTPRGEPIPSAQPATTLAR
jgi:beta-carotene hydroxylase